MASLPDGFVICVHCRIMVLNQCHLQELSLSRQYGTESKPNFIKAVQSNQCVNLNNKVNLFFLGLSKESILDRCMYLNLYRNTNPIKQIYSDIKQKERQFKASVDKVYFQNAI